MLLLVLLVPMHALTSSQAATLRRLVKRYWPRTTRGKAWNKRTDDELWIRVLSQIVVVGNAGPGRVLENSEGARRLVSLRRLKGFRTDKALGKHLHSVLRTIGTRYVGKKWKRNRKVEAAVHNYRLLMNAGGPRRFFKRISELRSERKRIEALTGHQSGLKYFGPKSVRNTLIALRLAKNCVALDSRIQAILREVGARVEKPVTKNYQQIEKLLVRKVAKRGLTGAMIDRTLFQSYDLILADLKLAKLR